METPRFMKLDDIPLRDAWPNEARDFTPWLASNLDHLGDVLGMQLEATGMEAPVERFAADILARDSETGEIVLIENQLETSDHTHLGQILTYLAGLEAKTVIWIAQSFREPHLSAVRWLNAHTHQTFSFFAVKARVVRIGASPFAPVFEVLERPSTWDRMLTAKVQTAPRDPEIGDTRLQFWQHYLNRHPEAAADGVTASRAGNLFIRLGDTPVVLSLWIGQRQGGAYLRGLQGSRSSARDALAPFASQLELATGQPMSHDDPNGHVLGERISLSYRNPENWDAMADWMETRRKRYTEAVLTLWAQATGDNVSA